MALKFERLYPLIFGVLGSVGMWLWHRYGQWTMPNRIPDLMPAIINVAAIAIGFLSAALAILFSITDSPVIRHLKDVDYFRHVVRYMLDGIASAFLLAIASGAVLLVDPTTQATRYAYLVPPLVGILLMAALAYFRVIRIFSTILLSNEKKLAVPSQSSKG